MERVRRHLNHLTQAEDFNVTSELTTAVVNEPALVPKEFGGMMAAFALKEQGVKQVYCLTGGHVSPIMVGCNQLGIRVVDVRDEVTTAFAADGTSRITGLPGVAIVTAGPGLSNTITAVKNAQLAESPLILFGGATAQLLKGRGALQDIDQHAMLRPHCKWTVQVKRVKDMVPTIRKAFDIAQSGIPGPVFVETPLDILWPAAELLDGLGLSAGKPNFEWTMDSAMKMAEYYYLKRFFNNLFEDGFDDPEPFEPNVYYRSNFKPSDVLKVCTKFRSCKKPIFILGSEVTLRPKLIPRLVEAIEYLDAPCYLSGMARGLLGRNHRLQMRHKRTLALGSADFIVLAGVPQDFRLDYGRHINNRAYYVQVHLDKAAVSRNSDLRKRDVGIVGDPCNFIIRWAEVMDAEQGRFSRWMSKLERNQQKREAEIEKTAQEAGTMERFVHPIRACRAIEAAIGDDSFIIGDGGDFVGTASYIVKPRGPLRWLDPGVFGTLGVGAGFGIAAKQTHPESEVWILYGDGAFGWSLCEFDTYVRLGLPVIAVIGNDACWSQMYRDQVRVLHDSVGAVLKYTHYEKVAEGFGAAGILVEHEADLAPALERAKELARGGTPVCVNILLSRSSFREGSISL